MTTIDTEALRALADAATPGPWERGDRQHVAGVLPERFGEGRCAYCHLGEPSWTGRMSINGTRMLAHVHTKAEPWWEHGIRAYRPDGSLVVVNDTDEYGYVSAADAAFIAAARTAVPALLDALAERDAEVARLRERERTLIRVKDADLDDLRHEIDARDALITDIAKIAASAEAKVRAVEAVASEHWDWKAGRSLHAAIRAALTPEPTVQAFPQDDGLTECPECEGTGELTADLSTPGSPDGLRRCTECNGTGRSEGEN